MGSLPEGFCGTPQELAQAIADRLIIQSDPLFSSFAIGSTAPTSNVGPWLKDCEEWYVWDDATAQYVRMQVKGAFNAMQVFDANGSFTVPESIYKIKVEAWGGGGGAENFTTSGCGGGGGGGYGMAIMNVIPGQVIPVVVGTGGTAGAASTDGGDSSVLTMTAHGGKRGIVTDPSSEGGDGGQVNGADVAVVGGCGKRVQVGTNGGDGGDAGGAGGVGGSQSAIPSHYNGQTPGGGGVGGSGGGYLAGTGAAGRVLIWY